MTSGDIGSIGLWLDIIGAFFLAESFILKKRPEIAREARTYIGGNPFLLRSASYQAIEARSGFAFLFLGAVGQLLGQTDIFHAGVARVSICFVLVAIFLSLLIYSLVKILFRRYSRGMVADGWATMMANELNDTNKTQEEKMKSALRFGFWLDLKQRRNEMDEVFVARMKRRIDQWSRRHRGSITK